MTPPALILPPPTTVDTPDVKARPRVDLRAATGDVVREMIRRDPALWERVQRDPDLRRQFGFEEPPPSREIR